MRMWFCSRGLGPGPSGGACAAAHGNGLEPMHPFADSLDANPEGIRHRKLQSEEEDPDDAHDRQRPGRRAGRGTCEMPAR